MKKLLLLLLFNFLSADTLVVGTRNIVVKKEVLPAISVIESNSILDINIYKSKKNHYQLKTDGSYEINLQNLKTKKVNLNLSGTGNISLFVESNLRVQSDAVVNINYIGNPKIDKQINFMTNIEGIEKDD